MLRHQTPPRRPASPVGYAAPVLPRRAFLGASVHDGDCGVEVLRVWPGSMAERAAARRGDVILAYGERSIGTVADLVTACREQRASPVRLVLERDDRELLERVPYVPFPAERIEGATVEYGEHAGLRTILSVPEAGADTVICFLPGIEYASVDYALREGDPVARFLAGLNREGFATFRVERPGLGDSPGVPCHGWLDEQAIYREAIGALTGFDRVILFGHSVGGMHAPLLADVADALIVYGTTSRQWSDCLGESRARQRRLRGLPPDDADDWPTERTRRFHEQLESADLRAAWAANDRPTLVLIGEHDWVVSEDEQREIPGDVVVLDGLDHAFTTHPALEASLGALGRGAPCHELPAACARWLRREA